MISLLPGWCFVCQTFIFKNNRSLSPFLCDTCYQNLPYCRDPACRKCGQAHKTGNCRETWAKHISRFQYLFNYEDPIHAWIGGLKYSRNFIAGRILQNFVKEWFDANIEYLQEIDFLLPVPVHPLRLRHRGFNQAVYLLNKQTRIPVQTSLIGKIHQTPHQAGLSRTQRKKNLRDSFEISRPLKGKRILLFDDVCTTGQTLGEVCKGLKKAGAERIDVLVASRTR